MTIKNNFSFFNAGINFYAIPQHSFEITSSSLLLIGRVMTLFNPDCTSARSCKTVGDVFVDCLNFSEGIVVVKSLYNIICDVQSAWLNRINKNFTTQTCPAQWVVERVVIPCLQIVSSFIVFVSFLNKYKVISRAVSSELQALGCGLAIIPLFYDIYDSTKKMRIDPSDPCANVSLSLNGYEYKELYVAHYKYEISKKIALIFLQILDMMYFMHPFVTERILLTNLRKHYNDLSLFGSILYNFLMTMQYFSATAKMEWIKSTTS